MVWAIVSIALKHLIALVCSKTSNSLQFSFGKIKRKRRNNSRPCVIPNRSVMWFLTYLLILQAAWHFIFQNNISYAFFPNNKKNVFKSGFLCTQRTSREFKELSVLPLQSTCQFFCNSPVLIVVAGWFEP